MWTQHCLQFSGSPPPTKVYFSGIAWHLWCNHGADCQHTCSKVLYCLQIEERHCSELTPQSNHAIYDDVIINVLAFTVSQNLLILLEKTNRYPSRSIMHDIQALITPISDGFAWCIYLVRNKAYWSQQSIFLLVANFRLKSNLYERLAKKEHEKFTCV